MNIRTLAKIAGCSPATVSRVLSGNHGNVPISPKTRDKILKICKEHDYEPNIHAKRMFSKRSGIIGLVTSGTSVEDANLSRFISGVYEKSNDFDTRIMLLASDQKFLENKDYLSLFKRREIDALIIWGFFGDITWFDEMAAEKFPFILASNCWENYPSVSCNDGIGMSAMVQQCLNKGAKNFVYIDGCDMPISHSRRNAFLKAIKGNSYSIVDGDFTTESGLKAAESLRNNLPDAIICVNDLTAIGVSIGLKKAGINIPKDVMLTGADNINLSKHIDPPLSTYDQMSHQCGEKCVELIMEGLKSEKPLESHIIQPDIYIRNSTL